MAIYRDTSNLSMLYVLVFYGSGSVLVLCISVLISPQVFNPSFKGNSLNGAFKDFWDFIVWVGKTETRRHYTDWISIERMKKENTFLSYWTHLDMENLPEKFSDTLFDFCFNFVFLLIWSVVITMGLYSHVQQWVVFFLFFWCISCILYSIIFFGLYTYEQPLRILVVFLGVAAAMIYYFILFGYYKAYNKTTVFISLTFVVKYLETLRALFFDILMFVCLYKFPKIPKPENMPPIEELKFNKRIKINEEEKQKFISWNIGLLNNFFFVHMCRMSIALMWGILDLIVAILMRPLWGNLFLFGNTGNQSKFEFLEPLRKKNEQKRRTGLIT